MSGKRNFRTKQGRRVVPEGPESPAGPSQVSGSLNSVLLSVPEDGSPAATTSENQKSLESFPPTGSNLSLVSMDGMQGPNETQVICSDRFK
ncbi:hypothetical protein DSO57_1005370 [Entomophthora muscae]|uniref:Uncharacterized protein n=1 Tax=Entomophthora muscae TaxID=34485 RepID=A0ACC2S9V5_9FUNG|nr:hypothetical protein DSO57_1005370 [Entomophthora muscae]